MIATSIEQMMMCGELLDARIINEIAKADLPALIEVASKVRDQGHANTVSYSKKVFIPLTHLCRDTCHYCTFARPYRSGTRAYMTAEEVLDVARRGRASGCKEALFTLGDKPELRWRQARQELADMGFASTLQYLRHVADLVRSETGLLPHLNPGVMSEEDISYLRPVSISMGLMLETCSERLFERGGVHFGSPDKAPSVRLETIEAAGRLSVPFTSGILIGIGETRQERIDSLLKLRELHERYGHLQEIIVQNFLPKAGTKMALAEPASREEHVWTISMARLIFGPHMNIQAPPNLSPLDSAQLISAGINDWGGVSPVTIDYVNPEAPWPQINALANVTQDGGKTLVERLAIYPDFAMDPEKWIDPAIRPQFFRQVDAGGYARETAWVPGTVSHAPSVRRLLQNENLTARIGTLLSRANSIDGFSENEIVQLFSARGNEFDIVCEAANKLREIVNGDTVSYVVTRNINYTNVCTYGCRFCAFSKGKTHENLRGAPYDLDLKEFARRVEEAWRRGATEICLQGGIHPDYTGDTYLALLNAAREAAPSIHIHAFSPLEVWQGARTLGLPLDTYLARLKAAGLGSLPGTAAEILDDEVRRILCPDKINTDQWFEVMRAAHHTGLRTTSTIMFGHIEAPKHWARHLLGLRNLQKRTGGFTEFVPLPFVAQEAPIFLRNGSRPGPTFREAVLMHAVGRLVLHPHIPHIQTSWVKMGVEGATVCLRSGADDLGGTLMNESITRAAGAVHGQEFTADRMEALIEGLRRNPRHRTTLYDTAPADRRDAALNAQGLEPVVNTPLRRKTRQQA
ncbi:5-amino-6-(D-ribitylamino)uracil--L-tyrosine 4-hydroxyphenyl transferase CofH [Agrobacterium rubi]|uniref:5-amino-6-(D-ribitylamino)uracil--L-tyrosine 4-hydroxyphenyl transferase CofH n=1 Tax=Agrobacterium rubi TaxID=28099 RepID=UPI001571983D|nr:5-amino-6-(D-ribitylamino)uracil--L-tyrosine 4-hydroxyphenyl transferase CofH [Agrobacterium rubi]NTF10535.1 5-amino-6-(D-ribitylamino)uracil--L-tyrosine 4-hydroxyphenyl transferase CofH [Agrobacterium rubi]NTF22929.1 5-amino-6-(D-ribitylamino)uracil--L-tyrosine 4-hydroxyphenyl transferase CofH [Agrobacterium rubi]NTF29860.1 5-amino-6-(D-ribitylamino)uracil--L-tyrosine 4-hydroxyphenyl transferase CofH [Agrobacterium rubi]